MNRQSESPVPELGRLLAALCENGSQHLSRVESDLIQTMFLLNEAIEKIGQHFTAIHQAVSEQQAELELLLAQTGLPAQLVDSKQLETLRDLREVIGDEVNSAVVGLQFHDLTSQLITRTISRANALRDLHLTFKAHGDGLSAGHESEAMARQLGEMDESLKLCRIDPGSESSHSVRQQHLGCGEVELF